MKPGGHVLGVDLSAVMLARASQLAEQAGVGHVDFRRADAQVTPLSPGGVDLVFSRFGVVFFADPVAAFANLRSALTPPGRMVFACWPPPRDNPWIAVPNKAAHAFYGIAPARRGAPGPFSGSDPDHTRRLLEAAGFGAVEITACTRTLSLAVDRDPEEWAHERLLMGLAHDSYLANSPTVQQQARRTVLDAVAPHRDRDRLQTTGSTWVVAAHPNRCPERVCQPDLAPLRRGGARTRSADSSERRNTC